MTFSYSTKPKPPFRLDLTVWTLRRRPNNLIDLWKGDTYRRVMFASGQPVEVAVRQIGPMDSPQLDIEIDGTELTPDVTNKVEADVEHLLGLRVDLTGFYEMARRDRRLKPFVERFRGFRPPRFPSLFETIVNGIACQQVTLSLGIHLLGRITQQFGVALQRGSIAHAFPRPEDLSHLKPESFRELGFSTNKGRAIVDLARAVTEHKLDFDELTRLENDTAIRRLQELRGIGRWTAEYALLRGFGRLDVFPGEDSGARKNLCRWLRLKRLIDYADVRRVLSKWHPWAGLVYFHLLLDGLTNAGLLKPADQFVPLAA